MFRALILSCVVCLCGASSALAQQAEAPPREGQPSAAQQPAEQPAPPPAVSADDPLANMTTVQQRWEHISEGHDRLVGPAMISLPGGATFSADLIDAYGSPNRLVAVGNVVFTNPEGQLFAERAEFNLEDGTGTFAQASGFLSLGPKADRAQFGNQEPDVYFYGDRLEKLGPRRYRITRGGFSTCVQPTPRWEITSASVTLNLDEYAMATNTLLKVKGVPLLYLPVMYYPIQRDARATGFLLPTYGNSQLRGQAISNAFFWAIDRSQDVTFFHDWFTKTGQGMGSEYRYISGPESSGTFRVYRFNQHDATFTQNGTTTQLAAGTSFEMNGSATQTLGTHLRARARIDYFSDLRTQQLYQQNIFQASRTVRVIDGSLAGSFGRGAASAQYQRNEAFSSRTSSTVYGSTPRITASLAPQRLFNSPVYASVNTEYAFLPYQNVTDGAVSSDRGFSRFDISPTIRVPLSKLTFLSVNASGGYRTTYYSRSLDPTTSSQTFVPESFVRTFATARADIVGPVFTRIWDRPQSEFAERLKHVIEPAFSVDVTSPINDYRRTPFVSNPSDVIVGGSSSVTYGVTNRLFSRHKAEGTGRGQTREFVTVGIQQTYYSNPESRRFDSAYQSSQSTQRVQSLSPVSLKVRVSPTAAIDANSSLEYDVSGGGLQVFSVGSTMTVGDVSGDVRYSRQHYSAFADPTSYMSATTRARVMQGRLTGQYSLNWDITRGYIVAHRMTGSYLAQCCGVQVEFQKWNYGNISNVPLAADRRFNISFILAGLGTFSNFFGAFGGGVR